MLDYIAQHEASVRFGAFAGVLGLMAAWELLSPRRVKGADRLHRWPANFGLLVASTLVIRFLFPLLAVGAAVWAGNNGIGLFNQTAWPFWTEALAGLILLDLAVYAQHVVFHYVPFLWRFHRIHHFDTHIDVTTGLRFHPVEIAFSMAIKIGIVTALGVAPVIVILFEIVLNACSLFSHANLRLPLGTDRIIRYFVVTPDMHRIHHSVIERETNSNFGFALSLWDRLFRTYRRDPEDGHEKMHIGQSGIEPRTASSLWQSLIFPFKR